MTARNWCYSPKGSAFLYAREPDAVRLPPLSVSQCYHDPFPFCFSYVGTRDVTSFLTVPSALDFIERFGAAAVGRYLSDLSSVGVAIMAEIGAAPIAPDAMFDWMRAYHLPQRREAHPVDAQFLINAFWDRHGIQVAASAYQEKLLLRVSAQIYSERADFKQLAQVLSREGWPGR